MKNQGSYVNMLDKYKVVYKGGQDEIIEKKVQIYCDSCSGRKRRRSTCFYRSNEEKILGCET